MKISIHCCFLFSDISYNLEFMWLTFATGKVKISFSQCMMENVVFIKSYISPCKKSNIEFQE